ncbi:MAG: carboxylesterase [Brevundimonas subvibrioides]|uniref:Carboxylic ester hydrolase n=1 Tax=Brevundimonas subvibrioides TaxID=74313 RepID=A0A258HLM0_9CAUL|nr:MAG: carboxylesterase [Brevundimonas subvibrioides]
MAIRTTFMRSTSLCLIAATLALSPFSAPLAQVIETPIPGDPVSIDTGQVRGEVLPSGVRAYMGMPFAAAPVRELRWRAPSPVQPWQGVYNADRKGPECIQPLRAHNINHYFGEEPTSEDCLYLNVWAPERASAGDRLPVIVYIYGGGSTIGSSGMALYGGEGVAARGAVFVNFNYRVGAMGYMAHPELTAESGHGSSGNYGHLDQVAALEWIQRNIARFGGDPDQVIVTGQSAGANSVAVLQASPLAAGLFRGAVAMSGGPWGNGGDKLRTLADAEAIGLEMQRVLQAPSLEAMRNIPADRVLALQEDCQLGCTSGNIRVGGANVDGWFLPGQPAALFAAGRHNDVPVIAGYAADESNSSIKMATTVEAYRAAAAAAYGADVDAFLALYPAATTEEVREMGRTSARDAAVARNARNWAMAQSQWGRSPTWIYRLARVHPFNPAVEIADHPERIGAYHTSDVPYWLGTQDALNIFRPTRLWTPEDRALSAMMTDSLIAFARTGNPATAQVQWPAWSAAREELIEFDTRIRTEQMIPARMDFHNSHTAALAAAPPPRGVRD